MASGVMPTPDLMPMQAQMMTELRAASGTNFDRVFVRQQIQAHEMALALHTNYAARGDTPALRTVAAAAAPVVRQHLDQAKRMGM
jgi:putative membrane protein